MGKMLREISRRPRPLTKKPWIWGVVFLLVSGAFSATRAGLAYAAPNIGSGRTAREAEISQILSALKSKVESRRLPPKARAKLATLSDARLRLIASLSKQMLESDRTLPGDVAFLLIASLLILS